ncbi:MAG: polyhydroxybutyrate depolymerase [Pirellulaceae bacterium]|jgi:polyhydroxybutyrate depolymerase
MLVTVTQVDLGRGAVPLHIPSTYDAAEPLPLIVALHGYSQTNTSVNNYFDLSEQIEENRFLYLFPSGNIDGSGRTFWNATDACCNFFGSATNDAAYLKDLVEAVSEEYAVDAESVHFMGLSNGGFMSHRMALEHADIVASIISSAGAPYLDTNVFPPSEAVHVVQVHGTADATIGFDGGCIGGTCYPGAEQTASIWSNYNGLNTNRTQVGDPFDLDVNVAGDEATRYVYDEGNQAGIAVELWELAGSGHVPSYHTGAESAAQNRLAPRAVDWLLSHRKTDVTPPTVVDVTINGSQDNPSDLAAGSQPTSWQEQRSSINSIEIIFDDQMVLDMSDLRLTNLGMDAPNTADQAVDSSAAQLVTSVSQKVATLTFDTGQLADGVYQIEILPTAADTSGNLLDGDGNGVQGDGYLFRGDTNNHFYQLEADWNGDGGVSVFDFTTFSYWFGSSTVAAPFAPSYVDLNNDDGISVFDFTGFSEKFGLGVIYPTALAGAMIANGEQDIALANGEQDIASQRENEARENIVEIPVDDQMLREIVRTRRDQSLTLENHRANFNELGVDELGQDLEQLLDEISGDIAIAW